MVDGAAGALRRGLGDRRVTEELKAPAYVSTEILERLVDDLTVEDVRLSRESYPEGDPMRGFAAVFYAAKRLGAIDGESIEGFLARVRLRDLTPILARSQESLPEGLGDGAISPTSAATGA